MILRLELPKRFFVTGTDTGIGKSLVSAILMLGLDASYWKPIQSGLLDQSDTDWIKEVTERPSELFYPETYRLRNPLSPHESARLDGVEIKLSDFQLPETKGTLIVEGAGGVLVPINQRQFMLDLIDYLELPVIVVAKSGLGTINHTLLTLQSLKSKKIPILGVVLSGDKNARNAETIEFYGNIPVIAQIERIKNFSPENLRRAYSRSF